MTPRQPDRRKWHYIALLVLLLVLAVVRHYNTSAGGNTDRHPNGDTTTVDYSVAVANAAVHPSTTAQLMRVTVNDTVSKVVYRSYTGYDTYYSTRYNVPVASVYELTADELRGKASRDKAQFRDDESIKGCAWGNDYSGSGYTRGHMTPAGDLKWDQQALNESFLMTNICPQDKDMNEGAWGNLELKVREWAARDKSLIVVTGPVLSDNMTYIGRRHRVAVPKRFYKVVLAPDAQPMRAIGFVYDNRPGDTASIKSHAVSVDHIEQLTGLDLFASLPDSLENIVERDTNIDKWLY